MDERKLTVIENTELEQELKEAKKDVKYSRHTNPIARKLAQFHHEKIGKFSVKDLFQK